MSVDGFQTSSNQMPKTWIEETEPVANPIRKLGICTTRRLKLAAATTAILLVCSSVEAGVKAEEFNSSSDRQVSTSTHTLVMRVPGEPDAIYWSLKLPKSFGIKASNLKENISTREGDGVLKNNRTSRIITRKSSRLRMKSIHWADLIFNKNFDSGISKIEKKENIKVDLFLGAYNFGSSFSELLSRRIKRNCIRLDVNADGLIPLANDPEKAKFNPTTGLPKDFGSCAIRTDGKSSKFVRRAESGDYDLEIDCWSNVRPGICRARSSFKGWPIRFAFPASLLNRHTDILNTVNKFLSFHTGSITIATHTGK